MYLLDFFVTYLSLLRLSLSNPLPGAGDAAPDRAAQSVATRAKLHRNLRVWGLLLDLEESLGTVASAKAAYDRVISLKVGSRFLAKSHPLSLPVMLSSFVIRSFFLRDYLVLRVRSFVLRAFHLRRLRLR